MRSTSTWCLLVALPALAADPAPDPAPKKPADPIRVRLVAKKTSYVLDRQGMTPEKYREAIKDGKIAPPAIDLVLEITNTTNGDIDITVIGASPRLTLEMKGVGPIEKRSVKRPRHRTVRVLLDPGATYFLPLGQLSGYSSAYADDHLYWTEPGEYTLSASFETNIREPRSKPGRSAPFISKLKSYRAEAIKLKVKLR